MKRGERIQQVKDLIKEKGSVALADVKEKFGLTWNHASVLMLNMMKSGHVKREGEKRHYRYSMP